MKIYLIDYITHIDKLFENTDGEMPKGKQKSIGDKTMIEKLKKAIRYYQYRKASRAKARQMVKLLRLSGAIRKLK